MKRSAKTNQSRSDELSVETDAPAWMSVGDIPGFPFDSFDEMQAAVAARSFNVGVDSFAASEWADRHGSLPKRILIATFSLLLVAAAIASVVAAFMTGEYWLLLAPVIQAVAFYLSHPASRFHRWATVGGALMLPFFINLLLNEMAVAATLTAYAGLTFAAVRAASYVANATFRKALLADEKLFLAVYAARACTLRNSRTGRVYSA